jgi:hypothetical protein
MSLQELTAALRQKEDDKSEVVKTLQAMSKLSTGGAAGRILFQVTECFFDDMKFDINVLPSDCYVLGADTDLNNKVSMKRIE